MTHLAKPIALLALFATVAPPVLFLFHVIGDAPMKSIMLAAAVVWFIAAPFWLREN